MATKRVPEMQRALIKYLKRRKRAVTYANAATAIGSHPKAVGQIAKAIARRGIDTSILTHTK